MDETASFDSYLPSSYSFGDLNATSSQTPTATNGADQQTAYGQGGSALGAQLSAIAGGYLSRRVDLDIIGRLQSMGTVGVNGNGSVLNNTPQTGIVVSKNGTVGLNVQALFPFLMIAALGYLLLNKA